MVTRISMTAYDKDCRRLGPIGGLVDPKVIPVHNGVGTATFGIRRDNPRWLDLQQPGARAIVHVDSVPVMSGRVQAKTGDDSDDLVWSATILDDFKEVESLLCLPDPANSPTAQTLDYDRRTGKAETVIKGVIEANSTGLTIAPSLGRGATVSASWRFHTPLERLDLTAAGLGLRVLQQDGELVVDCYEPRTIPQVLAPPMVASWSASWSEPTVTRVIAASQGQGAARRVRQLLNPTREAFWGTSSHPFVRTQFMDARDLDTADTSQLADLDRRMAEAMAAGEADVGAKVTLADTAAFAFNSPTGYKLGDRVKIRLDPDLPIVTDLIRSITFEESDQNGFTATPTVGDIALSPTLIPLRRVKQLGRRVSALERI